MEFVAHDFLCDLGKFSAISAVKAFDALSAVKNVWTPREEHYKD